MVQTKIFAGRTAAEALSVLSREKKVLFIMMPILSVVLVFIGIPLWQFFQGISTTYFYLFLGALEADLQDFPQPEEFNFLYLALVVPGLLAFSLTTMVWIRATISGRKLIWSGGFVTVMKRSFRTAWRLIAAVIWLAVFSLIWTAIFYMFVQFLNDLILTQYGPWVQKFLGIALITGFIGMYLAILVSTSAISLAAGVSLAGEVSDYRLPVHKSLRLLRRNLLRGASILGLLSFAYYLLFIGYFITLASFFSDGEGVWPFIGLFVMYLLGLWIYFFWAAYSALYGIKLVPDIEQKAFRRQIENVF